MNAFHLFYLFILVVYVERIQLHLDGDKFQLKLSISIEIVASDDERQQYHF